MGFVQLDAAMESADDRPTTADDSYSELFGKEIPC
jgi:hypothetical protein